MRNRILERDAYKESPVDLDFFLPLFEALFHAPKISSKYDDQRIKLALRGECFSNDEWSEITD